MRRPSLMSLLVLLLGCGKSDHLSFRQMHEAAVADTDKGRSFEAAARRFKGASVELDATAGETQGGVCQTCVEMTYDGIKFIAMPHGDLDPIKFLIFVEQHQGKQVHLRGTIAGSAQGYVVRSPLAVQVTAIQ